MTTLVDDAGAPTQGVLVLLGRFTTKLWLAYTLFFLLGTAGAMTGPARYLVGMQVQTRRRTMLDGTILLLHVNLNLLQCSFRPLFMSTRVLLLPSHFSRWNSLVPPPCFSGCMWRCFAHWK